MIRDCDYRGVVWAGNKIMFVASDGISTAFQFEVRMDHLVLTSSQNETKASGAVDLSQAIHPEDRRGHRPSGAG